MDEFADALMHRSGELPMYQLVVTSKNGNFTGCALTDRHFAKCETNCRVAKNKCVPTPSRHVGETPFFRVHRNAPELFPCLQNGAKIPAIS